MAAEKWGLSPEDQTISTVHGLKPIMMLQNLNKSRTREKKNREEKKKNYKPHTKIAYSPTPGVRNNMAGRILLKVLFQVSEFSKICCLFYYG